MSLCVCATVALLGILNPCTAKEVSKVDQASNLINKGILQQSAGQNLEAIVYFEKAKTADPNNWKAKLSLAKALMLLDRRSESLAILQELKAQSCEDFDREYQLGQAFLFLNKPDTAVETSSRALQLAKTPLEKSSSLQQLYLSSIRANQEQRARSLQHQVLEECEPITEQVYIRGASIASVLNPEASKELLTSAQRNLGKQENSGTFFRLAEIFDSKAKFVRYDRTKYSAWLRNSETAYKQAFKLNPHPPLYRIALANNAAKHGNESELIAELSAAHDENVQDQLPGYLLSKLKPMQVATANLSSATPQTEVKLTQAKLAVDGLHCSCKRSMIINSFKQIRGIVLTSISPKIPFVATLLVDESMIPMTDVLSKIEKRPLTELSYKPISSKQINGAAEALQAALDGSNIEYPAFVDVWPEFKPSTAP